MTVGHVPYGIGVTPSSPLDDVRVLAEGLAYPEGPVAMADGSVLFVEMAAGRVSRCDADGEVSVVAEVGGGPNGAARGPDGAVYVCNNGGVASATRCRPCVQRLEPDTGQVDVLYTEAGGAPLRMPNDLVFDDSGGFWCTDFEGDAILYAAADGSGITRAVSGAPGPNGVGLSPDQSVLYWSQTYTRQVARRRLASPGVVVASPGCSLLALVTTGSVDPYAILVGLPGVQELDSLAVERDGAVCVATLVDSGITVVPADGGPVQKLTLPEDLGEGAVTNLCFGGPDLRTAYITLSLTGRLVSCRWPRPGLRLAFQA
jgi:gluconolactonase